MGAMRQYARALIDGNLAEVALYAGNGPGAVFKGTDSHGNRCVCRAASLYHDGVTCVSVPSRRFPHCDDITRMHTKISRRVCMRVSPRPRCALCGCVRRASNLRQTYRMNVALFARELP